MIVESSSDISRPPVGGFGSYHSKVLEAGELLGLRRIQHSEERTKCNPEKPFCMATHPSSCLNQTASGMHKERTTPHGEGKSKHWREFTLKKYAFLKQLNPVKLSENLYVPEMKLE